MAVIQAVTFDGYGTLLELDRPFDMLLTRLAQRGVTADAEVVRAAFQAEMAYYRDHHLEASTPARLHALRRRCAKVLFDELDRLRAGATLNLEDHYTVLMEAIRFRAFHDWRGAVAACLRDGLKVGVISNWDCALPDQMRECGIDPGVFSVIVTSAGVGACKPDPVVFLHALESLGLDAGSVLHVGDDLESDALGARRAGLHGVLLDRDDVHASYAGMRISGLSELQERIRDIRRSVEA